MISGSDRAGVVKSMPAATSVFRRSIAEHECGDIDEGAAARDRSDFTHTSYNDYEIAAANLLDNGLARVQRSHHDLRAIHRSAARARSA